MKGSEREEADGVQGSLVGISICPVLDFMMRDPSLLALLRRFLGSPLWIEG